MRNKSIVEKLRSVLGAAWTSPIGRTAIQAAALVLTGAGLGWVDPAVWKMAALAAGAAVLAKVQELSRG